MQTSTASIGSCDEMQLELQTSICRVDGRSSLFAAYGNVQMDNVLDWPRPVAGMELLGLGERSSLREAFYRVCKRTMDIVISLGALILLTPIVLLTALMIKLYDRGPVFFSQERVGKDGRRFRCFKFRSMMLNAESLQKSLMEKSQHADPRTFKMADDPRVTMPGRIIRRFSIDELPQILNVLLGDMSIVGPRPPMPSEVVLYTDSDFRRLAVKPGLTCIWQVSGRSRLPFPEQLKMDVQYIQRRSLALDLSIILRTVPAVLSGDGAI